MLARTVPVARRATRAGKTLVGVLLVVLCAAAPAAAQSTYYVDDGGNDAHPGTSAQPFATIQHAIDQATTGDYVVVLPGTYTGAVQVTKSLTLTGAGAGVSTTSRSPGVGESVIDASGLAYGFSVSASNVTINGFDILGDDTTWSGVHVFGAYSDLNVVYNLIHGMGARNPNSVTYNYAYGVWGLGGGSVGSRGSLSGVQILYNYIFDLGGASLGGSMTSGGAGVFFMSTSGATAGGGLLVSGNRFADLADGRTSLVAQPGIAVSVLPDDDPGPDTGALVIGNTYTDMTGGVAIQTSLSRVDEAHSAFSGVPVLVLNVEGLADVDEAALTPFNRISDPEAGPFVAIPAGTDVYFDIGLTRYVDDLGIDTANYCLDFLVPCRSIGHAVELSGDGDTVVVGDGHYAESVRIDVALHLLGAGADTGFAGRTAGVGESVVDASGSEFGFEVASSDVVINGFDFTGNRDTWTAVKLFGTYANVSVLNNLMHGYSGANPNSLYYAYTYGVWGLGGGTVGNRGTLRGLTVSGNHIYDLGGSTGTFGTSGGAGVFVMSTTGTNPGDGIEITGNLFEDLDDANHALYGFQPGLGAAVLQDDRTATVDDAAAIYGNGYENLGIGVVIDAADSQVTEANGDFADVAVYVLNMSGRAAVSETVLEPFTRSDHPAYPGFATPAGSVAYFASAADAFAYANTGTSFVLNGNVSGVAGATTTVMTMDGTRLVIVQNGVEVYRGSPSVVSSIVVYGTSGDDVLAVDMSVLAALPTGALVFHGGAGDDSVTLTGSTSLTLVEHVFTNNSDGSVNVDGALALTYTGLSPILDLLPAVNRIFTFTAGAETVTLGDNGSALDGMMIIDSDLSESVEFLNPTGLFEVRLGVLDDDITVGALDPGLTTDLHVYGGSGSDGFTVTPSAYVPIHVHGEAPVVAPGDVLDLEMAGAVSPFLTSAGSSGNWGFANREQVHFDGIESQIDDPTKADLALTKSAGGSIAYPGDVMTFTLTLTNLGASAASGIAVSDVLPPALACLCAESASEGTFAEVGGTISWTGIDLAVDESATLSYTVTVASTAGGTLTNTAAVTAQSPSDPATGNNASTVTLTIEKPIRFPAGVVVQALAFVTNPLGQIETLAGTHNFGLYRSVPGVIGNRWAPVRGTLGSALFVNDLLVSSLSGTVYMAVAAYGGLYQSTTAGRDWTPVDFGDARIHTVNAITESPVDGIIYISADDGQMWRYVPGSADWDFIGRLPHGAAHTPWSLAADPSTPGLVFAGTFGAGVFRSRDYGENWVHVSGAVMPHDGNIHVFDLKFDPELTSPQTLWAGTSTGVYFSQDGGESWVDASAGLDRYKEVRSISFGPVDPSPTATGRMYAATWGGGVFEMPSDRASLPGWEEVTLRGQTVTVVAVDPSGAQLFAAPGLGGAYVMPLEVTATDTQPPAEVPASVVLDQNYPNPFNPTTTIAFGLPEAGPVRLQVFDLTGRRIATLVDGVRAAGRHLVRFDAGMLPSGPYLYRLQAGGVTTERLLMLMK